MLYPSNKKKIERIYMLKKVWALSLFLLITTISIASITSVQAASDVQWLTDYSIYNSQTGQLLLEYDSAKNETNRLGPILPNSEIKIIFTVNVIASGEGDLRLTTALSKPTSGPYWSYDDTYDLGSSFSPNSAYTSFNWEEGTFEMTLYGRVSSTTTGKTISAVTLSGPSGTTLDKIEITVTSAQMDTFLSLLEQKEDKLQSLKDSGVDPGFLEIYENVLEVSKDVANGGDVSSAIALLNGLDVASEPASSTMQMLFLPLIIIIAIIAVIFVVLFLRLRGKISYIHLVVEDQIKDLEGLTLRASKIDRTISANLESVKDRLKHLVGM